LDHKDFSDKEFLERLDINVIKKHLKDIEEREKAEIKEFFNEFKQFLPENKSLRKHYKDLYKNMKGLIQFYRKDQLKILTILLTLDIFKEPYKEMNWPAIKKRFNEEHDIEQKIMMLLGIINQRKVCTKTKCRVYPGISEAQKYLTYLNYTTLEAAEENLDYRDFEKYKEIYYLIKKMLDLTFIEVFKLSSVHDTVRANKAKENEEWRENAYIADKARKDKKGIISNLGSGQEEYLQRTYPLQSSAEPSGAANAYSDEGKRNDEQLRKQFGNKLEGLKKKKEMS